MTKIIKFSILWVMLVTLSLSAEQLQAKTAQSTPQCTLITKITGYTPVVNSKKLKTFTWLAINSKGKIMGTGSHYDAKKLPEFKRCQQKNAHNQVMLPGLTDAHGHVLGLAKELSQVNLRGIESEQQTVATVAKFAKENPQLNWIQGRGWNQVLWKEKVFPTKKSLDAMLKNIPVVLRRVDGHAIWVNSKVLDIAKIDRNTRSPKGGEIVKDKNGEPTGVLIDNAMALVNQHIPKPTAEQNQYALNKAFRLLLSLGITGVHDAGVSEWMYDFYKSRASSHTLPVRIYGMLSGDKKKLNQWLKDGIYKDADEFLSIRSVKLYADGALGSRGAALLKPYSDDPHNRGLILTQPDELFRLTKTIISHGFQVNVHAIGDRGNRLVLDTYEKVFNLIGGENLRNRIEHSQIVDLNDIPRFKQLNVIASMQPTHATSDMNMAADRLGKKRLKGAYAWRKFLDQGTIVAAGSDFPVEYANAFYGLFSAITRQDHHNQPKNGWLPDEKMTPTEALRSFTLDAAYAAFQEQDLGSLEIGKWADFILINEDIINGKADVIWKTQVLETWIAGKKVYQKK